MKAEQTYLDLINSIINPMKDQISSLEHQAVFNSDTRQSKFTIKSQKYFIKMTHQNFINYRDSKDTTRKNKYIGKLQINMPDLIQNSLNNKHTIILPYF